MQKIRVIVFFFVNSLHCLLEVGGKNFYKRLFWLHVYFRTNKILIHNFLYVFGNWGETSKPCKDIVQLLYENVYPKGKADPDNQRTEDWDYTVPVTLEVRQV